MAIKIIEDGPPIVMTRSEYERLVRAWHQECTHCVNPPPFEEWVRDQKARAERFHESMGGLFRRSA